jgi:N-acetylmuramoyl-L-alanine amidase
VSEGEKRHNRTKRPLRKNALGCLVNQLQLGLLAVLAALTLVILLALYRNGSLRALLGTPEAQPSSTMEATTATVLARSTRPRPTATPRKGTPPPTVKPKHKRVGILAGHSGPENDPGAICEDGTHEADINLAVAQKVEAILLDRGYEVDLLEEFDERLTDYQANAFLAIHTDSCEFPEANGFKVAHVTGSAIPEIEDKLVECLYQEYGTISGLPRHDFSITPDMHEYHAFMQIAPQTPGAIIELGFLAANHDILTKQQDKLAAGVANGLLCFLEQ